MGDVVGNSEKTRDVGISFIYLSSDKGAMGNKGETPKDIKQH
jgi:hypothetical protein